MPKVSVIIPTYNRADLIGQTLDSVMSQSFTDWECLIIDDHSTDNTRQTIDAYIAKDKRIKYYLNSSVKGAQGARNTGINYATGSYLMFLDSDDLLAAECLSNRLEVINENPGFDYYCFPTAIFKETPGDTNLQWNYLITDRNDISRFLGLDTPWHTSGVFWTKPALTALSGWDEKLASYQDWDIHLRALLNKGLTYYKSDIHGVDTYYRLDDKSATISKEYTSEKNVRSTIYLVEKFYPLLHLPKQGKGDRLAFAAFIYFVTKQYRGLNEGEAVLFLNKYLSYLGYSPAFIKHWAFYLTFRRNAKYNKVLRKLSDLIPYLYRNNSLLKFNTTLKRAVI